MQRYDPIAFRPNAEIRPHRFSTPSLFVIGNLQEGELNTPYVERTLVAGGEPPYALLVTSGALPEGLALDATTGVLSGTPKAAGEFDFTVEAADAVVASVTNVYKLNITKPLPSLLPVYLSVSPGPGPWTVSWPLDHTGWFLQIQTNALGAGMDSNWVTVPGSDQANQFSLPMNPAHGSVFLRLFYP